MTKKVKEHILFRNLITEIQLCTDSFGTKYISHEFIKVKILKIMKVEVLKSQLN